MNFCHAGGYLVEGNVALATDPIDHDVNGLPIHGCPELRCPSCGARVKSVDGFDLAQESARLKLAELHDSADPTSWPYLAARPGTRLYYCRCKHFSTAFGRRPLEVSDPDPANDPIVPWRCPGHRLAELPHAFDGEEVTEANVGDLVLRSLRTGWSPAGVHREDYQAGIWAARMWTRLAGTPWQEPVLAAALAVLDDADPMARSRAMRFFATLRHPAGSAKALAILSGDRAGWTGEPEAFTVTPSDKTLEQTLWRLASPLVAADPRARDLARTDALATGKASPALYAALAGGDSAWVIEHAQEIARANPELTANLVTACRANFVPPFSWRTVASKLGQ